MAYGNDKELYFRTGAQLEIYVSHLEWRAD